MPIIERLGEGGFRRVSGALELAGLKSRPARLPAFFVVPQGETAETNRNATGVHDQRVVRTFGVVIMLASDARREEQVSEELEQEELAVKRLLTGWLHPEASAPAQYAGANLLAVNEGVLSWMVSFKFPYRIRSRT